MKEVVSKAKYRQKVGLNADISTESSVLEKQPHRPQQTDTVGCFVNLEKVGEDIGTFFFHLKDVVSQGCRLKNK